MPQGQSNENARWWSDFHRAYAPDSERERAFTGYLAQRGLLALELSPEALDTHQAAFITWWNTTATPEGRLA